MDTIAIKQGSSTCCVPFTVFGMIKCNSKNSVTILLPNIVSDYRKCNTESVHVVLP